MASAVYLLDTNVVLQLLRGKVLGRYLASTFGLLNTVNRPLISIVTHGELGVIADRNKWGAQKLRALQSALDNLVTIDLNDRSVLQAYVSVQRFSQLVGRELNANDAWIVACAKAADALLLTTDGDFKHLKPPDWQVHCVDPTPFL
jgi:predicted nucleic acid-binding protein